jgi:methanogenesis marker radical SAM protein
MAHLTVDIGGRPGLDCRGFCSYCYFKHAKDVEPFGCRYCLPFSKGCDYCSRGVKEQYTGFKDLRTVTNEVLANLQMMDGTLDRITISGGGDPSCYPWFTDLIELLSSMESPLHIGYTSGKGFDDPAIGDFLVDNGLTEISYTVFSSNPGLRKQYMHDPTPEASLSVLERLCESIEVYAADIILPGVNDGDELLRTLEWLDERGAKGCILMRFANTTAQGLILGNAPIMKEQRIHTVEEFRDLVTEMNDQFSMKISGTPLWDPSLGSPFAIIDEPDLLEKLPKVSKEATVITGNIAAPYLQKILDLRGGKARVIGTEKEIACLITIDDLKSLDLSEVGEVVIIPGRAFVHDQEAQRVLSRDGTDREVIRGPETLTADGETSMGMERVGVLHMELEGFSELIRLINQCGR